MNEKYLNNPDAILGLKCACDHEGNNPCTRVLGTIIIFGVYFHVDCIQVTESRQPGDEEVGVIDYVAVNKEYAGLVESVLLMYVDGLPDLCTIPGLDGQWLVSVEAYQR